MPGRAVDGRTLWIIYQYQPDVRMQQWICYNAAVSRPRTRDLWKAY